ncbi:MAG: ABC transporter permease [Acidobacteriota bacterium]
MDPWLQDVRTGWRSLWRHRRISVAAVLCIALGVGVNSVAFSTIDGLLFKPLDLPAAHRLVTAYVSWPGFEHASFSFANYRDIERDNEVFESFAAARLVTASVAPKAVSSGRGASNAGVTEGVAAEAGAQRLMAQLVTAHYFDVLGVAPARGRAFQGDSDELIGSPAEVILGHDFWRRRFSVEEEVLGETLRINGRPFRIIGIMPRGFHGTYRLVRPDVYLPVTMAQLLVPKANLENRGNGWLLSVGRLSQGVSIDQARASLNRLAEGMEQQHPRLLDGWGLTLVSGGEQDLPPPLRSRLASASRWILALAALVLLVACANVASLLLARDEGRRRELAIRRALGAGFGRLSRQLVTESGLLALLGSTAALSLAWVCSRWLPAALPDHLPVRMEPALAPDGRVLAYALVLCLVTAVVCALAPALRGARGEIYSALGSRGRASGRRRWGLGSFHSTLVIAQLALSLVLLASAGLFVRSLQQAQRIDPGFRSEGVLLAAIDPSLVGYDEPRGRELYDRLLQRVASLPGVESAALGEVVPLGVGGGQQRGILVEGYEAAPDERMNPDFNVVGSGYFELMEMALVAGRTFDSTETPGSLPTVVVNRTMAERYWPPGEAVGGRLSYGGPWARVVGVVEDIQYQSLGEAPRPYLYLPWEQVWEASMELHVRSQSPADQLVPLLRREVATLDPALPVFSVRTLREHTASALYLPRLGAGFVGAFGLLALGLAVVGLAGVMAYGVRRARSEMGIRIALGADPRRIFWQVLRQGLSVVSVGVALGLLTAVGVGQLLAGFLYGTSHADPVTLGLAAGCLVLVAAVAVSVPARRAMKVDPVSVLREE